MNNAVRKKRPARKLIEVSIPLEKINEAASKKRPVKHPWSMSYWWARRPLPAARAILFCQLVDDPTSNPELFPTEESVINERARLHDLAIRLAMMERTGDKDIIKLARHELLSPTGEMPPSIVDPFAGGGSIPLEAQRLGLQTKASDLNPVATLINLALLDIPSRFSGLPPVSSKEGDSMPFLTSGTTGLSQDVAFYGERVRAIVEKEIGPLYPQATLPDGSLAPVVTWIWARTITCPNPGCGITMPLTRSWWLSKKKDREAFSIPTVTGKTVSFSIGNGIANGPKSEDDGTVNRRGATCVGCRSSVSLEHIRAEGRAGRIGAQLLATVAAGQKRRIYLSPTSEHENAALVPSPKGAPDADLPRNPRDFKTPNYGMTTFSDLFSARQLTALMTFSNAIKKVRKEVVSDACSSGMPPGDRLESGGTGAEAYGDAIATYLSMTLSRMADGSSTITTWHNKNEQIRTTFSRQAIPMTWDFIEPNLLGSNIGSWASHNKLVAEGIPTLPAGGGTIVSQEDASRQDFTGYLISTDPPYYDNIGYSDLSDFFYIWLRRTLSNIYPQLMSSMLSPKSDELIADQYRHNGREGAHKFFEKGFREVFQRARKTALPDYPITVYYAFKQQDSIAGGEASTGWETILESMIGSGWEITATWPMRSELSNRMLSQGTNALASSIVLALRPRPEGAPTIDRRGFINELKDELPIKLRELQQGAIAPVDLPQAAIGPGMAVFSRYSGVLTDDGSKMTVRAALARINEILDEVLAEQEGDFDGETRFAIAWFRQHGFAEGSYGDADGLARARNASLEHLERSGILTSRAGKVALHSPGSLDVLYAKKPYDPAADQYISVWEVVMHASRLLGSKGLPAAAALLAAVPASIDRDLCKELAFLLFTIAEDRKETAVAVAFNALGTAWNDIIAAARTAGPATEFLLDFDGED